MAISELLIARKGEFLCLLDDEVGFWLARELHEADSDWLAAGIYNNRGYAWGKFRKFAQIRTGGER